MKDKIKDIHTVIMDKTIKLCKAFATNKITDYKMKDEVETIIIESNQAIIDLVLGELQPEPHSTSCDSNVSCECDCGADIANQAIDTMRNKFGGE